MAPITKPDAIDLSHHLSELSKARLTSPLKGLQKYFGKPGIISLAGGLPHADYFPFHSVTADALVPNSFDIPKPKGLSSFSWLWNLFSSDSSKEHTAPFTIPKYPTNPDDISLSTALQYSMASGIPQLQKLIKEFTEKVYQPGYADFVTLVHVGNTDGWTKAFMTLCNPGEGVLACEWTYPSALSSMHPFGIRPVPISMDGQGMRSDHLRKVLSEWDVEVRGMPRPHVMYTVPVGQNPTGCTMEAARKKEIYDICVEFDVIIVEDDPYYFLQQGPYLPKEERSQSQRRSRGSGAAQGLSELAPSYIKFDYQGRVIRLDSFSKTIAPGSRMGWFTCNPVFAERLERQAETSTQAPCGFSQSIVTSLLLQWKYEGYVRWLDGLRVQYRTRRDFFIDCLGEEFHLQLGRSDASVWQGCDVYQAFPKIKNTFVENMDEKAALFNGPLFSFVPPTSGMFVWVKLHLDQHPLFEELGHEALEVKLWTAIAEAGVLFGPGSMFTSKSPSELNEGVGHFRISFSNAEFDDMKRAVEIFAKVLNSFHKNA